MANLIEINILKLDGVIDALIELLVLIKLKKFQFKFLGSIMGFWSSIGDAISSAASATYNAVKTAVVATKNFVVSAAEAVGSAVAGAFDWVYNKMKQLVNTLTEWKDNALKLLSLTYPTWLAISIFGAGALLLLYAAILGPALIM